MAIGVLLVAVYGICYLIFGGPNSGDTSVIITEESKKRDLQEAEKAVQQYQLAKQNGSAKEACANAGKAFALYGSAGFDEKMKEWVMVANEECK